MTTPKKSFGQHFLKDAKYIQSLVHALEVPARAHVVEIGPGRGALTDALVGAGYEDRLILLEADRDLIPFLTERYTRARIIETDAAKFDFGSLSGEWVFVGNLPYNAAAAILEAVFVSGNLPTQFVFMVQKEQAQRMLAPAGEMSLLSLAVQLYTSGKKVTDVPPAAFQPPPKVDSRIIRLIPRDVQGDEEAILAFAKPAFAHRRKQLRSTLGVDRGELGALLEKRGYKKEVRPQELLPEDWRALYNHFV